MKTGKVVLGTLAALALGAIAGILLAPEKGSKTRKQIIDKGNDLVGEMKSKYNKLHDSLTEKFDRTAKDVDEMVDKGKVKYHSAKKEAKESFHPNGAANIENSTFKY